MEERYFKRPSPQQLANTKYKESDYPEPVVEVEDENWGVLTLFTRFRSQLVYGGMGPVGLNMMVYLHELDRMGLEKTVYDDYVDKLLIIEPEALKWIYRNQ